MLGLYDRPPTEDGYWGCFFAGFVGGVLVMGAFWLADVLMGSTWSRKRRRNQLGEAVRGPARRGKGLLAGLVRCGRCGKKMQVNYRGRSRPSVVYYFCRASQQEQIGKQNCSIFGGVTVEQAVVEAVLDALSPVRMEAIIEATAQFDQKHAAKRQQFEFDLARARYEADRCQRQYQAVDPENRLVANTLESRWDKALVKVGQLQQEMANFETSQKHFSLDDQEKLRRLACDLPRLWNHEAAPFDLKKDAARVDPLAGRPAHRNPSAQTQTWRTPVEDRGKHTGVDSSIGAANVRQADCCSVKPNGDYIVQRTGMLASC
jgi:hypothetical protein